MLLWWVVGGGWAGLRLATGPRGLERSSGGARQEERLADDEDRLRAFRPCRRGD